MRVHITQITQKARHVISPCLSLVLVPPLSSQTTLPRWRLPRWCTLYRANFVQVVSFLPSQDRSPLLPEEEAVRRSNSRTSFGRKYTAGKERGAVINRSRANSLEEKPCLLRPASLLWPASSLTHTGIISDGCARMNVPGVLYAYAPSEPLRKKWTKLTCREAGPQEISKCDG